MDLAKYYNLQQGNGFSVYSSTNNFQRGRGIGWLNTLLQAIKPVFSESMKRVLTYGAKTALNTASNIMDDYNKGNSFAASAKKRAIETANNEIYKAKARLQVGGRVHKIIKQGGQGRIMKPLRNHHIALRNKLLSTLNNYNL